MAVPRSGCLNRGKKLRDTGLTIPPSSYDSGIFCQDQPKNIRVQPLERAREKWYDSLSIPQVLVPGVLQDGFRFDVRQVQKV